MIGYQITRTELERRAEEAWSGWPDKASERTAHFRGVGKYDEESGSWSNIKSVFMDLQHSKCCYCERLLEFAVDGTREHDLEHYRPKKGVKKWPPKKLVESGLKYSFALGDAEPKGYYWLAYDVENYCVSCKQCNAGEKANYFPVAGSRMTDHDKSPREMNAHEQPFLIMPVGELDEDPETLIKFEGVVPLPTRKKGARHRRALVTIEFFDLLHRETLLYQRAEVLVKLWLDHLYPAFGTGSVSTLPSSPHSSCAKNFSSLIQSDPVRAERLAHEAAKYVNAYHQART